jgi:hypothetical protein
VLIKCANFYDANDTFTTMMLSSTMAVENADPNQYDNGDDDNVSPIKAVGGVMMNSKPPRGGGTMKKKKERVSFSPTKSPGAGGSRRRRRRSSSAFATTTAATNTDDDEEENSDIEFTLDGAVAIGGGGSSDEVTPTNATSKKGNAFGGGGGGGGTKKQTQQQQQRRRRRSSARFLAATAMDGGEDGEVGIDGGSPSGGGGDDDGNSPSATSSEHLGEIYRRAIRMNAENKINANNSWGFKLIENMDKFIVEDGGGINDDGGAISDGISPKISPRDEASEALSKVRKMKNKDERGRVNFAKASCAIDASVKIYSYRVDDVHLSSFRVLANLNRSDNTKDDDGGNGMMDSGGMTEDGGVGGGAGGTGEKVVKRRTNTRPADTLESNMGKFMWRNAYLYFTLRYSINTYFFTMHINSTNSQY